MEVYSVVATVALDAMTSAAKGSYEINVFATRQQADDYASRCNQCCTVPGIAYAVQAVDEMSPERLPTEQMLLDQQRKAAVGLGANNAYKDGIRACNQGQPRSANPHDLCRADNNTLRRAWYRGWDVASYAGLELREAALAFARHCADFTSGTEYGQMGFEPFAPNGLGATNEGYIRRLVGDGHKAGIARRQGDQARVSLARESVPKLRALLKDVVSADEVFSIGYKAG